MKITQILCHQVVVPTHPQRVNSPEYGPAVFDQKPQFVLQAQTDQGIKGIGQMPRAMTEPMLRNQLQRLKDLDLTQLCLQDPPVADLSSNDMFAHEHPTRSHRLHERSFVCPEDRGIYSLLLDLIGNYANLPAYMLLGGCYRQKIRVDSWMGRMTPQDSARICQQAQAKGARGIKCKCALEDDLVERAEAIRQVCGKDFKITFDPNFRFYRVSEALPILKQLAQVGNVGCVEDPFPHTDFRSYRILKQQGLFPIALHTSSNASLYEAILSNVCDYVNLVDTPWNTIHAGNICMQMNTPTWHGSAVDLGILEAMYLHTCAATRSMTLPSDILGREIRQHNLITNPLTVTDGCMTVPNGPGLGVQLDQNALDRYTIKQFTITLKTPSPTAAAVVAPSHHQPAPT